jgi:hypothetical protein
MLCRCRRSAPRCRADLRHHFGHKILALFLDAGADLVQGYTGFVYMGPGWARLITRGLNDAV